MKGRGDSYSLVQRQRKYNFSFKEKELLVTLIERHGNVVESRTGDGVTIEQKVAAWADIQTRFNEMNDSSLGRSVTELKKCYWNLKQKTKKALDAAREAGGTSQVDRVLWRIAQLAPEQFEGLLDMHCELVDAASESDAKGTSLTEPADTSDLELTAAGAARTDSPARSAGTQCTTSMELNNTDNISLGTLDVKPDIIKEENGEDSFIEDGLRNIPEQPEQGARRPSSESLEISACPVGVYGDIIKEEIDEKFDVNMDVDVDVKEFKYDINLGLCSEDFKENTSDQDWEPTNDSSEALSKSDASESDTRAVGSKGHGYNTRSGRCRRKLDLSQLWSESDASGSDTDATENGRRRYTTVRVRRRRQPASTSVSDPTVALVTDEESDTESESECESRSYVRKRKVPRSDAIVSCRVCKGTFKTRIAMQKHVRECHKDVNPFECHICGKIYKTSSAFGVHQDMHSGNTAYKCSICKKVFLKNYVLTKHLETHKDNRPRPHKCDLCDKAFTAAYDLKRHYQSHRQERPHKCEVCGKAFTQNGDLWKHRRTHTNDKLFKCGICQRTFTRKDVLAKHMFVHTGEKPYKCKYCDRTFSRRDVVNQHQKIHEGEYPYGCEMCGKRFSQKSFLIFHFKSAQCASST